MEAPPNTEPRPSATAEAEAADRLTEAMADALGSLDPQVLVLVDLNIMQGWPLRRVAREMGLSPSTAHHMKEKAMAALREKLKDDPTILERLGEL